jgi:hypothetical protein
MKKIISILAVLIVLAAIAVPVSVVNAQPPHNPPPPPPPHENGWRGWGGWGNWWNIPTFSIQSVVPDTSVTIVTNNFPAGVTFTVLMGAYGTLGIGGIPVTTVNSGGGGSFTATYAIPAALKGSYRIAIRLQDANNYYYAYNWLFNDTSGVVNPPCPPGYFGIPTFFIQSVVRNSSVTITTNNFPANDTFNVYMGYYGTLGNGGIPVTSVNSGSGGSFTATYTIPAALDGLNRIAIRLQDTNNYYYAYNWFWNNN